MEPTNKKSLVIAGLLVVMFAVTAFRGMHSVAAKGMAVWPGREGKLALTVFDAQSSAQLANAEVVVVDGYGTKVASGMTGSDGYFSALILPGTYKAMVRAGGYIDASVSVQISGGQITQAKAALLSMGLNAPA